MNICEALEQMKTGKRFFARPGWGHREYLYVDGEIIMLSSNGFDSPWQAAHLDLMAADWVEVTPHP